MLPSSPIYTTMLPSGCAWGYVTILLSILATTVNSNWHAKKLYNDVLIKNGYNKLIRPVANNSDTLTVKLGLRLTQLIGIDEKNQIMTTNVWLSQEWDDINLKWNPKEYGGVSVLYVPSEEIWLPDIVLYNNADGNYQVTLMTKATVHHTGRVFWEPPAIYKSSCTINVEFFPFDEQTCGMKFGSWTYDGIQVDLKHKDQADVRGEVDIAMAMDMSGYYRSFIWDVLEVPARRNEVNYPCCPEFYPDVTFKITIRRKTLFYTVNLIIPCVAISFLTVFVFYLPSDSGEKITLCISILLSLTVFFLLLADLIPPTSLVVPLIGKYLLFTMILVTLSVIITVVVLNIHNRTQATHTMSPWLRTLGLEILPKMLLMKRPILESEKSSKPKNEMSEDDENWHQRANGTSEGEKLLAHSHTGTVKSGVTGPYRSDFSPEVTETIKSGYTGTYRTDLSPEATGAMPSDFSHAQQTKKRRLPPEIARALDEVKFIADHLRDEDEDEQIQEDWKYIAMVIDRLFLWIYTTAVLVGTLGIILQAPTLYDMTKPMDVGI